MPFSIPVHITLTRFQHDVASWQNSSKNSFNFFKAKFSLKENDTPWLGTMVELIVAKPIIDEKRAK